MQTSTTEKTIYQYIAEVSDQHYAMTGGIMALSAAQATALGEACLQISLDNQVDTLDWQDVTSRIEQMAQIKVNLLEWSDQNTRAVAERVALRQANTDAATQRFWFESTAEICRLSIDAAMLLQNFRPLVFADVRDDLEVTISLLTSAAYSAVLLLDSNLNIWPETALRGEYDEVRAELQDQIDQLSPVDRLAD